MNLSNKKIAEEIYSLINIKRKNEYETNNYYTLLSSLTG